MIPTSVITQLKVTYSALKYGDPQGLLSQKGPYALTTNMELNIPKPYEGWSFGT